MLWRWLRVKDELDGKKVRCQKCNGVFVVAADLEDFTPTSPTAKDTSTKAGSASAAASAITNSRKPAPTPAAEELAAKLVDDDDDRPRRRRRRDDDDDDDDRDDRRSRSRRRDDDDDDDRPRRRKNRKKSSSGSSGAMIASIGGTVGGLLLIVAVIGLRIYLSRPVRMAMNNNIPRPNFQLPPPGGVPGGIPPGANGVRMPNNNGRKIAPMNNAKTLTFQNGVATAEGSLGFFDKSPRGDGRRCRAYKVDLEANTVYTIEMRSLAFDSYVYLMDPDGTEIAEDDDSGNGANGLDSQLTIQVQRAGTYEIHATSFTDDDRGSYTLTVRKGQ